jgi:hypothetical protein
LTWLIRDGEPEVILRGNTDRGTFCAFDQ